MIYHIIPWTTDKNLGGFYNRTMHLIGEEDWACFLDADAIHTTTYFGKHIEEVVKDNPEYGMFTGRTNKILCTYQLYDGFDYNQDLDRHRKIGSEVWEKFGTQVRDITNEKELIGGFLLLISKKSWKQVGGFKEEVMLTIDNDIHQKFKDNNLKFGLMLGIYIQHWYRGDDIKNKSHLLNQ